MGNVSNLLFLIFLDSRDKNIQRNAYLFFYVYICFILKTGFSL